MKKLLIVLTILFLGHFSVFSQSQIRNGNFELWDDLGTENEQPTHWNSFKTASGKFSNMGKQQVMRSDDTHSGKGYSLKIFAKDFGIATANGMVTTGQVNMGSVSASNFSNHTITRTDDDNFRAPLNIMPDSISFWAKFECPSPSQEALMKAVIHIDFDYKDPGGDTSHIVAVATKKIKQCSWTKFTVPFTDFTHREPAYILITFATNAVPGAGSKQDVLFIDDVELIYKKSAVRNHVESEH